MAMSLINVGRSSDLKYVIFIEIIADKVLSELKTTNLGIELSCVIGVHFETKKSLKSLAISLKSAASLLSTFNIGINIFLQLKKNFKIDEYVLELVDGSINF